MRNLLIEAVILVAICLTACTNPKLPPEDKYLDPLLPTTPIPANAKALEPLPHVVNRVVYFYGTAPEKNGESFKEEQAARDYFDLLMTKLKHRHGAVDALAALKKNDLYLLVDEPGFDPIELHTMLIVHSASNTWRATKKQLTGRPFENCFINRLQGFPTKFQNTAYFNLAVQYSIDWNSIMLDACAQRTGNFKRPPDQRPKR